MATITEVARHAGVGVATVSRVLNGSPAVREETRRRVLAAIAELSYAPNPAARALSTGRTLSIGVVAPFFTRPSVMERLRGVAQVLAAAGYQLVLFDVERPGQDWQSFRTLPGGFDGLLSISLCPPDADLARFEAAGMPVILIDHPDQRLPGVLHRRRRGRAPGDRAPAGARPPADRVHRRLRAEPHGFTSSAMRRSGYEEALAGAGLRRGARARAPRGARARARGGAGARAARLGAAADRDLRGLRHSGDGRAGGGRGARRRGSRTTSRSSATTTSSWPATRASPPSHSRSRRAARAARSCCWPRSRARPPAGSSFPSSWSCAQAPRQRVGSAAEPLGTVRAGARIAAGKHARRARGYVPDQTHGQRGSSCPRDFCTCSAWHSPAESSSPRAARMRVAVAAADTETGATEGAKAVDPASMENAKRRRDRLHGQGHRRRRHRPP